jgi:hypothetical protein
LGRVGCEADFCGFDGHGFGPDGLMDLVAWNGTGRPGRRPVSFLLPIFRIAGLDIKYANSFGLELACSLGDALW